MVELQRVLDTELETPYGVCMYQHNDQPYLIANDKNGQFVQYVIGQDFELEPVRRWQVASQPEGCVADDRRHQLYVGEEAVGVWRLDARPDVAAELTSVARVGDGVLVADVEGMALFLGDETTYLVVSSQGDNSFAVYDVATDEHVFSFHVADSDVIDGASETDGLDVTSVELPGFPGGLLVVQDGYNLNPAEKQNFKMVAWKDVLDAIARD